MAHIFGPVPSRRLGRSLGVDVIPYKTCTFDCIYCECGATTNKTCAREEFFPLHVLLDELEGRLSEIPSKPDVVTLSGAGEPTLYKRTGELIREAKRLCGLPVAVITNSSLLDRAEVREELLEADIVLPSLDTADEDTYRRLNRPHEACKLQSIIDGIETFLKRFEGMALFEVLFLDGFNTDASNLEKLKETLGRCRFDKMQINTAVRPGTESDITPVELNELERIATFFGSRAEIIADAHRGRAMREDRAEEEKVLALLERRPCTVRDVGNSLGITVPEAAKLVSRLVERKLVKPHRHGSSLFYTTSERGNSG